MNVGDTFYDQVAMVPDHLNVLVAPAGEGKLLGFNLTDRNNVKDDSCIIQPGEHEFVVKESAVDYRHGAVYESRRLDVQVKTGLLKQYPPVSAVLLEKIQQGALRSTQTLGDHQIILKDAGIHSSRAFVRKARHRRT